MNQVFVGGTFFHIYVSILRSIFHSRAKNLFINNNFTPGIDRVMPALRSSGFFDEAVLIDFRPVTEAIREKLNLFNRAFRRERIMMSELEQNTDILHYDEFIRSSEINLFHHKGLPAGYFIMKYRGNFMRMLEDGSRNYFSEVSAIKHFRRKHILNTFVGDGLDDCVKEIHVQHPERLPLRTRHKGVKLELKKMQQNLSRDENQRILNVFMNDQTVDLKGDKKLLLITQTLSEDRYTTEEYKVDLYKKIIREHAAGYKLYIKPHPRETTNYREKLDCDFTEIPRSFPMEMFDLMKNITFDRGVTISCNPIFNIDCVRDKVMLGKEIVKERLAGKVMYQ